MSRRGAGIGLIAIAAIIYATRFLTAAIWGNGVSSWSKELFNNMLGYVDQGLTITSLVCLAFGILYLVWAEVQAGKNGEQ